MNLTPPHEKTFQWMDGERYRKKLGLLLCYRSAKLSLRAGVRKIKENKNKTQKNLVGV